MDGTSPSIDVRMCVTRCAWIAWMYMSFVCLLSFSQPVEESRTPVNSFGGVFLFFFLFGFVLGGDGGSSGMVASWHKHSVFLHFRCCGKMYAPIFLFGVLILCVTRVLFVVVVRLACVCVCESPLCPGRMTTAKTQRALWDEYTV